MRCAADSLIALVAKHTMVLKKDKKRENNDRKIWGTRTFLGILCSVLVINDDDGISLTNDSMWDHVLFCNQG